MTLIAFEGIDGAGTTTQAERLCRWLSERRPTVLTQNPSPGVLGKIIRRALSGDLPFSRQTLALTFAADRLDNADTIRAEEAAGNWVVTDRCVYSSLAYQALDLPFDWVDTINCRAPEPDLTFYLRVSSTVADARRAARGGDSEIFEKSDLQRRVAEHYDRLFSSDSPTQRRPNVVTLDGEQDPDALHDAVVATTWSCLGR